MLPIELSISKVNYINKLQFIFIAEEVLPKYANNIYSSLLLRQSVVFLLLNMYKVAFGLQFCANQIRINSVVEYSRSRADHLARMK